MSLKAALAALAATLLPVPAFAQTPSPTPVMTPDCAPGFASPTAPNDWVKRVVMTPMRDGVKLYRVIVEKRGARAAPILLTRPPYNAKKRAERPAPPHIDALLPQLDEPFV